MANVEVAGAPTKSIEPAGPPPVSWTALASASGSRLSIV
jgi:hypothetical protein